MIYTTYNRDLLQFIQRNSGLAIEELKEKYLDNEAKDIITSAKVSFDEDIKHLQELQCISITENIVTFVKWIDLKRYNQEDNL